MASQHPADRPGGPVDLGAYQGWLFDLDGVLTRTAEVHAAAWKQAFDEFLEEESQRTGVRYDPFDPLLDYERYVDGEAREDGVRHFLAARDIHLPEGATGDPPEARSVNGVGNHKNALVLHVLETHGVSVYDGAARLVRALRAAGAAMAVVSASENAAAALAAGGIAELFDALIDGHVVKERHLAGKPAPDSYLAGARALGVDPAAAVVVEDALAGVEAGRAGHFGLVVGVDHHQHAEELRAHGADVVVTDLAQLLPDSPSAGAPGAG